MLKQQKLTETQLTQLILVLNQQIHADQTAPAKAGKHYFSSVMVSWMFSSFYLYFQHSALAIGIDDFSKMLASLFMLPTTPL